MGHGGLWVRVLSKAIIPSIVAAMLSIRASSLVISSFLAPVEASMAARLFIILRNMAISVCNDGEAGAGEGVSGRDRAVGRSFSSL